MSGLLLPVGERRMSSWAAHQRRSPRSSEPGTDFYCPIGTPVLAPADGVVYGSGNTIGPATGRWVGLDLNTGQRFRAMHFSRLVSLGRSVTRGQVIGYSGASGYGKEDWSRDPNTGGAHTHVTLWPTHASRFGYDAQGRPFTVDFMNYVGGSAAGGSTGDDVMNADQEGLLVNVGKIVTELRNMLVDPSTGLWKVAVPQAIAAGNAAKASADNGANIAAEIRNLIVDPRTGVLAAISRISTGDIDEAALATSLAETLGARLGPEVAAAVLDGAAQRLVR